MKFAELKSPDIARMDKSDKVVLVPLGSLEQHGPHCPLMVDSLLGGEMAARVEAMLPETVLLAPTLWLGSSDHHLTSPGTMKECKRGRSASIRKRGLASVGMVHP